MKLSLCNEVVRELPFERQCELAAELGYRGLELAPFTLGEETYRMPAAERAAVRRACADAGIAISGLHWLLVAPQGALDHHRGRRRARSKPSRSCGGSSGSAPISAATISCTARRRSVRAASRSGRGRSAREAAWAAVAEEARAAGVTYCIEPLARRETDFVNTVAEAAAIVAAHRQSGAAHHDRHLGRGARRS